MTARRSAGALTTAVVAALLLGACSGSNHTTNDKTGQPTDHAVPSPTSNKKPVLVNSFDPTDLLSVDDAQRLVPGLKITGRACYKGKKNHDLLFPSNDRRCDFMTDTHLFVRVATTVDDDRTQGVQSALDNSGLLADTGGSTGRNSVYVGLDDVETYYASVYVACRGADIRGPKCPAPGEAKKADRIAFSLDIPGAPHGTYVTVIIGVSGQEKRDIPVARLTAAADTAIKNLKKEFAKR